MVDMMPCIVAEKGEKLKLDVLLAECWYCWPAPELLTSWLRYMLAVSYGMLGHA